MPALLLHNNNTLGYGGASPPAVPPHATAQPRGSSAPSPDPQATPDAGCPATPRCRGGGGLKGVVSRWRPRRMPAPAIPYLVLDAMAAKTSCHLCFVDGGQWLQVSLR